MTPRALTNGTMPFQVSSGKLRLGINRQMIPEVPLRCGGPPASQPGAGGPCGGRLSHLYPEQMDVGRAVRQSEKGAFLWAVRGPLGWHREDLLSGPVLPPGGPLSSSVPRAPGRVGSSAAFLLPLPVPVLGAEPGRGSLRRSEHELSRRRSLGSPCSTRGAATTEARRLRAV